MNAAQAVGARLTLLCVVAGAVATRAAAPETTPPAPRQVPGLTTIDTHPRACTDCHIVYPELGMDARLGARLQKWTQGNVERALLELARASAPAGAAIEGRHPESANSLRDVPNACTDCHDDDSTRAPPFSRLIHLVYLSGAASNHFTAVYQGECTLRHKLDTRTGRWSVPSGPAT